MNLLVLHPWTHTYFAVDEAIIIDTDDLPAELKAEYEQGADPHGEWYEHGSGLRRIVEHYLGAKK